MSLLVCGDDTPVIDYYLNGKLKYSIFTPLLENKASEDYFKYSLKYLKTTYKKLFEWVNNNSVCLITSDLDYEIPMRAMGYKTNFIPNPVNTDTITYNQPEIKERQKERHVWKSDGRRRYQRPV